MASSRPERAQYLIATLDLQPHPEGGYYREVFRSSATVSPADDRGARSALTTIFFLLPAGRRSRLHRVASDEVWHFYEGAPLDLYWIGPDDTLHRARLGPAASDTSPVAVVPAGCWQTAGTTDAYSLVGCSVGPGFDFADFEMIDTGPEAAALRGRHPALMPFF